MSTQRRTPIECPMTGEMCRDGNCSLNRCDAQEQDAKMEDARRAVRQEREPRSCGALSSALI
jgi:hypothetical protein